MTASIRTRLREVRKAATLLRTSTYEISSTCNLTCEGCLFFSGEHAHQHADEKDAASWRAFFRKEAERGITFAFLAGAEPALALDRLRAAWAHIPAGMIVTNGTRRIPDDIGYRIHVSLWGAEETSAITRGADVTSKALRNYAKDPRAMFVYTINAMNLGDIRPMAQACADQGVPLTFNYYSPTEVYQGHLNDPQSERTDYFRFSSEDRNLIMGADDYKKAGGIIRSLRGELPDTIIYSDTYDAWVTGTHLYDLDENGIARNCASRSDNVHSTFFVDQAQSDLKCSNPTFDCRECRTYASGMTSHVRIETARMRKAAVRNEWSDAFECWDRIFVGDQWERLYAHLTRSAA